MSAIIKLYTNDESHIESTELHVKRETLQELESLQHFGPYSSDAKFHIDIVKEKEVIIDDLSIALAWLNANVFNNRLVRELI